MSMRDENGYPLEGIDVVPNGPRPSPSILREETIPRLVQLLQDANRRAQRSDDALTALTRKYNTLKQDYAALRIGDLCENCQIRSDSTPNGDTVELCHQCGQTQHTLESLKRELVKKDEEIRYWQDCHEAASLQLADFPDLTLGQ